MVMSSNWSRRSQSTAKKARKPESIGMLQHRVLEGPLAIAFFAVVPVIGFQSMFQSELRTIGHLPFTKQKGKIAVKHETIDSTRVLCAYLNGLLDWLP